MQTQTVKERQVTEVVPTCTGAVEIEGTDIILYKPCKTWIEKEGKY